MKINLINLTGREMLYCGIANVAIPVKDTTITMSGETIDA